MRFLIQIVLFVTLMTSACAARPNIVIILADDQGWGDLGINGNALVETPHIDRLAEQGARFEHFYVSPVCSPTRAELLTGRYHTRCGVYGTSAGGERLNLGETTMAEVFQKAGYRTAAFGKWHSGMQYPYHPNARGFEEFYGFCSGHWGNYFNAQRLEHNGRLVQGEGYITDDLTNRAMRYIEEHAEEPFFVYLPYCIPHSPMQVPDAMWEKYKDMDVTLANGDKDPDRVNHARAALAMSENIDWNVGRVMRQLETLGLEDNTIVLYFTDNGPNGHRWNGGMRGIKGSTDEGGVRSPLFIHWPDGIMPGTRVEEISAAIDLLPTLADLVGIPVETVNPMDGKSLVPLLQNAAVPWPDRYLFSHWSGRVSLRSQQYRLDHKGRLYDMLADPGQETDIGPENPGLLAGLKQDREDWRADAMANYHPHGEGDRRPIPVGHPEFANTQLPARDGESHGTIERSNRYPNCSYFTNWTSSEDAITWNVEVLESGLFEVELHYTCPAYSLGTEVELSFGNSSLKITIMEAHDPPETGMENDRTPRSESYVKDFKPVNMGTIYLEKGSGPLRLTSPKISGGRGIDFRLLMLERVPNL